MNNAKVSERFTWAVHVLQIKPTQNILEIGCGAGLLAEQIACRLTTGKLIAIDKSSPMLEKAKKRNDEFINNGVSKFIRADFAKCQLQQNFFDSIVAFNVPVFWKNPVRELERIRVALKVRGKLYVFYQAPYEIDLSGLTPIQQKLLDNSFEIIDVKLKKLKPTSAFCLIAKPKKSRTNQ